ncbi:tail fiber domain-containing protein [Streptococcus mitis]|uniref:phage tail spike protein n=1 Tax=Streptococcus mitis TaxID=28037 RepID=UPI00352E23D1
MIYLTNGNMPLNAAYADEIVQEDNSTYQLSFRFPTSDSLWEQLKEEAFLTADDIHGEQDFVIFEVEKKHGYIQVYANQVFTLLNNYVVSSLTLDQATGSTALSRFAGAITRNNPFSFFSDIEDRHTFNIGSKNAMEAFAKDKHSILGQWGGDLVRHGYQVRLLKNGGSENESLFMYKKNLSSYQHKTSTKSLKTRITFKTTVKGEGEKAPDRTFTVTIDSPLINKYSQIYEDVIEVNDQDVKDEASLRKYGEQYFRTTLCDMMEDSLELEVVGQSDVPVQMFDIVSLFHDVYNLDVRKKITKYTYSPMGKKLKTIGFGQFKLGLANAIGNAVSDAVKGEAQQLQSDFERQLARELKNADLAFDRKAEELKNEFEDGLNVTKAKAEEVKRQLSDTIDQRFSSFNNGPLQEAKRRAEEALRNAGASTLLAQEAKRIGLDSIAKLEDFKRQATSAQAALSGDLDVLKQTIANDVRPKQAQAEAEIAKQVEALVQTKKELAGVKSAQATYEETTTRRLAELTNLANGKASKSELTQTAEELASRIASVRVGGRNYYRDSEKIRTSTRFFSIPLHNYLTQENVGETWTLSFDLKINEGGEIRPLHFYHYQNNRFGLKASADITPSKEWQRFTFTGPVIFPNDDPRYSRGEMALYDYAGNNNYSVRRIKLEKGTLATDWSPAIEDIEGQLSTVESNFRQRADSLDAGVRSLTEGLRSKADISSLNVTAENIRQSVKSLETDTQNKLNQKLSLAEFEVRAGSIRQEILNATKDKADKTLVVTEAGKLRTELSTVQEYVKNDGQRQESLQRYARDESARQVSAVREQISRDYVGKSAYQEDVRGLERRFSAISTQTNNDIATKIAQYKQTVDGQFASITSQIAGKANQVDFQRVRETSQLYERILGNTENGIADKVARMSMTNQLFQVEVGKAFAEHQNLFLTSTLTKGFLGNNGIISVANATQKEVTSDFISVDPNEKIIFQHWVTLPENGMAWTAWQFFDKNKNPIDNRKPGLNAYKTTVGKQHNINQITIPANAYFVRFSARMYDDGLIKVEQGSTPSDYSVAPNDALEAVKTVQRQLAGSWAVQNINGVGSIVSQINATNNQILIEAEKIRLKGKTLLDELTAIQGYFKRLFVGEGAFAKLNAEIIGSKTITADKLIMDQAMARLFVSSNIFTDALAAKEAFINKLRSVVVTATLLEGFQGLIGGFRFGQYPNRNGYFITGISSVSVGMGNGTNAGANRNAFWANWGESLDTPGPKAWYVNTDGKMYCRNEATFHSKVDFSSISNPNFYSKIKAHKGVWVGTDDVNGEGDNPDGGYNRVVWWSQIVTGKWRQYAGITTASDKKLKENIESTPVRALDKINALNLVAFDYIKDKTHEEIGLIAQEVQDIIPSAVLDDGNDSYLSIQYSKFVPYLIKAVQELHKKIEKLEKIA